MGKKAEAARRHDYPIIEIDRRALDEQEGYQYIVRATPGNRQGYATILVHSVFDLQEFSPSACRALINGGLQMNDLFGGLARFYPNGETGTRPYARRGVGSYVLERILDDSREEGIRAIYAVTRAPSMICFLEKKGFNQVRNLGLTREYYCIL